MITLKAAIHVAVMNDNVDVIEFLVAECEIDLGMKLNNKSLLHLAALSQSASSIRCLIDLGHEQYIEVSLFYYRLNTHSIILI